MKIIIAGIITCIVVLLVIIIYKGREDYMDGSTFITGKPTRCLKPKIFWTYWDGPEIPISVKKCISTWEKHNPDYDIIILNRDNLHFYCDDDIYSFKHADTPQRISDFVRLAVLSKHGGTWVDSSSIMSEPLQDHPYEYVGYYIDVMTKNKKYPVIENWFISCVKNCQFIKKWKDIFYSINDGTVDEYLHNLQKTTDFQGISGPTYLTMHVAAQYVLQNSDVTLSMYLMRAENGPFKYLVDKNWDSWKAVYSLVRGENITPLIKLRGAERNILEDILKSENEIKF